MMTDPTPRTPRSPGSAEFIRRLAPLNRVLYPGVAVALFMERRYEVPVLSGFLADRSQQGIPLPSIALAILLGSLVYLMYRALVHPVVWFFQARTLIGMPARETHRRIVDRIAPGLAGTPARDSVLFSQACLAQFQAETLGSERRADTAAYNAGSHILYMTATLGLLFLLHDAAFWPLLKPAGVNPALPELVAWTALFAVGLLAAVVYDRTADYREAVAVWRHEEHYRGVVESALRSWSIGRHRFTRWERLAYLLGDGVFLGLLTFVSYTGIKVLRGESRISSFLLWFVALGCWWFVARDLLRRRLESRDRDAAGRPRTVAQDPC